MSRVTVLEAGSAHRPTPPSTWFCRRPSLDRARAQHGTGESEPERAAPELRQHAPHLRVLPSHLGSVRETDSDSGGPGRGLGFCISAGDAMLPAGPGRHREALRDDDTGARSGEPCAWRRRAGVWGERARGCWVAAVTCLCSLASPALLSNVPAFPSGVWPRPSSHRALRSWSAVPQAATAAPRRKRAKSSSCGFLGNSSLPEPNSPWWRGRGAHWALRTHHERTNKIRGARQAEGGRGGKERRQQST